MKNIIKPYIFVITTTVISIIFMLNLYVKELPPIYKDIETFKNIETNAHVKTFYNIHNMNSNKTSELKQAKKDKNIEGNQSNANGENKREDPVSDEMIQNLIKQRERVFNEDINKSEKKSNNINLYKVVVTPEKILKVQRDMDFNKKSKALGLLVKLGPSGMSEIVKMSQDGVTTAEGYKMMDILKEHLSEDDIKFLKDIVKEYFQENSQSK